MVPPGRSRREGEREGGEEVVDYSDNLGGGGRVPRPFKVAHGTYSFEADLSIDPMPFVKAKVGGSSGSPCPF